MKSKKIAVVLCNNMHMDIERANELLTLVSTDTSEGYQIISDYTKADIVIIMTCAYGNSNKAKTIRIIADVQNNILSNTYVIITGCLVNICKCELENIFSDFGVHTFEEVKAMFKGKVSDSMQKLVPQNKVVISMGCRKKCSYCVYPQIEHGGYSSKPMETVLQEVAKLYYSETIIYITGGHETSDYGIDLYGSLQFAKLMDKICTEYPKCDYVIGWFHPAGLTDEVIQVIVKHKNIKGIMVHIQHVSNRILRQANRPSFESTDEKISVLKALREDLVISTQVITGLPGETEKEFAGLIRYLDTRVFRDIGVSSYEEVAGTKSARLENRVPFWLRMQRMDLIVSKYGAKPYPSEITINLADCYNKAKCQLSRFPKIIFSETARKQYNYIAGTDTDYKEDEAFVQLMKEIFEKVLNSRDIVEISRTREWLMKTFTREFRSFVYEMLESSFASKYELLRRAKDMLL